VRPIGSRIIQSSMRPFKNRSDAGQQLAAKLAHYTHQENIIILALPRGGVPIGLEIAKRIHAPMDVFIVRKLGVPNYPELAMGAFASGEVCILNDNVLRKMEIPGEQIDRAIQHEQQEVRRREELYRANRQPLEVEGRIVILVDDGIATGSTMKAGIAALRQHHPSKIVVAVPTMEHSTYLEFRKLVDEVVAVITPRIFSSVAEWYENFSQLSDDEVRQLLKQAEQVVEPQHC
jgi:putative phosphoribosyl transferase